MHWEKKGLVFVPDGFNSQMYSHATIPFVTINSEKLFRIYFSSRNINGKSLPFYIDIDSRNFSQIEYLETNPLLNLGELGTFDDSGIMPSCIVSHNDLLYMYYIGWNPQVTVSYRLSIGLAISQDGGNSFKRYSNGPICDRDVNEPYFNTAPFVIKDNGIWRMWYISCTHWKIIKNYPEPAYHIKYAESKNGINWQRKNIICIDYDHDAEAIGRPSVFKEDGIYKMYYSYRKLDGYRTNKHSSYRLGYAESIDGIEWIKKNNQVGIETSENINEWDYEMIEYCHVISKENSKFMFYNGNGFGKSGIGYASISR